MSTDLLRVGIVGAGAISQVAHLPVLSRRSDVEVVAMCDIDPAKARALARRFNVADVYDDIEDLLRYASPDAVAICTPNHLHEIHVETALSAGAHVLCERPVAVDSSGVETVVAAQRRSGKVVLVGFNHRYRSDVQAVRGFLKGGELGRVHAIRTGWYTFRPARQALGWRRRRDESGGGAMLDLGLPLIDLAIWLSGCPGPRWVTGSIASDGEGTGSVEDSGCALLACDQGPSILVDVSWHFVGESERWWCHILGSEGSATVSPLGVFKELHGAAVNVTPRGAAGRESIFITSYAAQWASFLAMVRGHLPAPALEDQRTLHRVMDALYESARTQQSVEVSS